MSVYQNTILKNITGNIPGGAIINGSQANQVKFYVAPQADGSSVAFNIKIKASPLQDPPDFTVNNGDWSYISFVETDSANLIAGADGLNIITPKAFQLVTSAGNNLWYTVEISNYVSGNITVTSNIYQ